MLWIIIAAAVVVIIVVIVIIVILAKRNKKGTANPADKYKVEEVEVPEKPTPESMDKSEAPLKIQQNEEKPESPLKIEQDEEKVGPEGNTGILPEGNELTSNEGLVSINEGPNESEEKIDRRKSFPQSEFDDSILESEGRPQGMFEENNAPDMSSRPNARNDY